MTDSLALTRRKLVMSVPPAMAFAFTGLRGEAQAAVADVARTDTFIATGQTSGGSPTFSQYNDFNPFRPGLDRRSSVSHVLEALYYYNVLKDEMIPWLATDYSYSDDYTAITVELRQGVTWNDGEAFDADDVIYTLDMLRRNGQGKSDMMEAAAVARDVKDLVRVNDHTVRVELTHPDPRWFFTFLTVRFSSQGLHVIPEHVYGKVDPNELATFTALDPAKPGWPVGTGAFRIAEMTPERIVLDRRDDWWGKTLGFRELPVMKRVIFVPFTTHEQAAQLLVTDEVDTILEAQVPVMKNLLSRFDKITTFSGKEPPYGNIDWWPTSLFFNHDDPQWQDLRIRRAVSLYVDRDQAVDYAYEGASEVSGLFYPRYPALQPYFDDMAATIKSLRIVDHDPGAADALMKEAGAIKDGEGFWTLGGKRMGGDLYYVNSLTAIAPVIAEQLRRAGFEATPNTRPGYRDVVYNGKAAWWLWGHGASVNDPYQTLRLYHKQWYRPIGENVLWPARWRNDEFSALVDRIQTLPASNPEVRPLVQQALTIWLENQVACPLCQFYHRIPFNTTWWTGFPTKENPYITPTFWHDTGYLVLQGMKKAGA
ncbi:MAG TPA: ABC transporter substrate-binding protein [Geminicoccaceae bacterium]|nr:ABC transporter substrate-binding protein [Geminicoccus sp.]HMU48939.1 ABC transporter substrate-binding protein [Geminicoccaceae bacterium]